MKKFIAIMILLAASLSGIAQNKGVKVSSFTAKDRIMLRWAPEDYDTWKLGLSYGYKLERFVVDHEALRDTARLFPERSLNLIPMSMEEIGRRAANDDDFAALEGVMDMSTSAGLSRIEQINMQESRFGMALLLADFSPKMARAQAISFTDSLLPKDAMVGYRISIINNPQVKAAYILINPKELSGTPSIPFTLIVQDEKVVLKWNLDQLEQHYVGYFIERSESGDRFTRLNKEPLVKVSNDKSTKDNSLVFSDSLAKVGNTYHYKLVGLTPFGFEAAQSDTLTAVVEDKRIYDVILRGGLPVNGLLKLTWQCPDSLSQRIVKWELSKATDYKGRYSVIEVINDGRAREVVDKSFTETSYYRIKGWGERNPVAQSGIVRVMLVDTLPPAAPAGLKGNVDRKGLASLSWSEPEKGIKAYNIFRSFSRTGKPVPVTSRTDTTFREQLQTGISAAVFYYIQAVDERFNQSKLSEPLELFIPDSIPPVPAFIRKVSKGENGSLQVTTIESPSYDVASYELCTKGDSLVVLQQLAVPLPELLVLKKEKSPFPDNLLLRTTDKSGNTALSEVYSIRSLAESGITAKLADVELKRDRKLKRYTLTITNIFQGTRELKIYTIVNGGRPELDKVLPVKAGMPVTYTITNTGKAKSYKVMVVGALNVKPVNVDVL